jgi:hypothetical protein
VRDCTTPGQFLPGWWSKQEQRRILSSLVLGTSGSLVGRLEIT